MLGAIIGDTVGSRFEFDNYRAKDFELFTRDCELTDDSIMTLAVMEIMQKRIYNDKDAIIDTFKKWGRAYPYRGYGESFGKWITSDNRNPYNSFGNGAAMRISPVGYYANSEEEVKTIAKAITEVTHNHPEGLKGAEVTAMCIYYAKVGKSKEFIKDYASKYYNLDFDYETLKKIYEFNETCQDTVPQAIYAFLISTDFEDAIRTAVSIGGDSDTVACITGGIAEAYYKHIPEAIVSKLLTLVPDDIEGCNLDEYVGDYLDERLSTFTNVEEIGEEAYILADLQGDSDCTAMSFQYAKSKDVLIDYIINDYREYEISNEDIQKLNQLRTSNIEELNLLVCDLMDKYDLIQKFVMFSNPTEALAAIGEDYNKTGSNFYRHIFNQIYINVKE